MHFSNSGMHDFSSLAKFSVLFLGEIEPHATTSDIDTVPDRLLSFKIEFRAAAPGKLGDHVLAHKCELLWERGFEILFQELNMPGRALYERHVDSRHGASIGKEMAKISSMQDLREKMARDP
jgi:hypothetical protein